MEKKKELTTVVPEDSAKEKLVLPETDFLYRLAMKRSSEIKAGVDREEVAGEQNNSN